MSLTRESLSSLKLEGDTIDKIMAEFAIDKKLLVQNIGKNKYDKLLPA